MHVVASAEAADFSGVWERQADVASRPAGPGPRGWADMTYDSTRGKPVVFAGSGSTYLNDIWVYETLSDVWTEVEPVVECDATLKVPPTQRDEPVFEYDPYNDLYWTFGGTGFACTGPSRVAESGSDTVTVVDSTLTSDIDDFYQGWTVQTSGRPAYVDSYEAGTRTLHLMTPVRDLGPGSSYRLFTQRGGGTFHYSPVTGTWTGFEAPYWGYTGPVPMSRLAPAFAYSDADQALVMFGGRIYNDTWAMDVQTQTWIKMNGTNSSSAPPKRREIQHSMVYDQAHDLFVLFGGLCTDNSRCTKYDELADTWTYNLKTNTWTEMHPAVSPSPRQQHNMAYDPHNGVVVLYGGRDGGTAYNDVWVYDISSNTWSSVATSTAPPARSLTTFAYDQDDRRFVLYGGKGSVSRDVWQLTLNQGGGNASPVAVMNVTPSSGDLDTSFSFDGTGSSDADGSIASYTWDFGDGNGSSGPTASHQYAVEGNYTVRLTVTDDGGAPASTTGTISVSGPVAPLELDVIRGVLHGTVNDASVNSVLVNGSPVPVDSSGAFEAPIDLSPGVTTVTIEASGSSGSDSRTVTLTVE